MNIKIQEFWNRVTKLTSEHCLSQQEICDYMNLSIATYKGWRSKLVYPNPKYACDLAKLLNTTVEYLVYGNGPSAIIEPDIAEIILKLKQLTPEQRKPVISIIEGQIDYWKDNS